MPPQPVVNLPGLHAALALVLLGLLIALLVSFLRTWRETKSRFGFGLVLFAGALALQVLLEVIVRFAITQRGRGGLPPLFGYLEVGAMVAEAVAIGILLYNVSR